MGSNSDWVGPGPIAHACPGQYPDLVIGPAFQLVQHDAGGVEGGHGGIPVGAAVLDEKHFIVHDGTVRTLYWRGQPGNVDRRRTGGFNCYITWWCTRYYDFAMWVELFSGDFRL